MQSDEYLKLVPGAKDHPRRPSIAVSEDGMTMTRPYRNHLLDSPAASSAIIQLKESTRSRCGSTHMNSRPSEPTLFHTKQFIPWKPSTFSKMRSFELEWLAITLRSYSSWDALIRLHQGHLHLSGVLLSRPTTAHQITWRLAITIIKFDDVIVSCWTPKK
ncbi:hypothetical protein BC829DRAFT_222246 [Chytridium lagenaria]|nr:hypothetical protein BC829DRAFT_222246 [Chytridium lagenaria]